MTDLATAHTAAELGMSRALEHAERVTPDWGSVAYLFLQAYARGHAEFQSEDVSDYSREWGLVQPPTLRAWGHVYKRAQRDGVITVVGLGKSRLRHGSPCYRWRSNILGSTA